jgi:Na+/H+ antiporter NhaA
MTELDIDRDLDLEARLDGRTNTCAIIALLTALLGLMLPAIVFGIIGIRQCNRRDEEGWGMAFAAVSLGVLILLGTIGWVALYLAG